MDSQPCRHLIVLKSRATGVRRCTTCGKIITEERCPKCGNLMSDLILLTSKSKYCKHCDTKKSQASQPVGELAPVTKKQSNSHSWIDDLTAELDFDDFFEDQSDPFDPNKP